MENASKALLMAGTILIGILIIAIAVYLASNFSQASEAYYKRWTTEQVQQYNDQITKNFITENGKTYVTAQGIITIRNLISREKYQGLTTIKNASGSDISPSSENILQTSFDVNNGTLNKYEVTLEIDSETGIIKKIAVKYP